MSLNADKSQALRFVNRIRARYGVPTLAELPLGFPHTASSCPVAVALHNVEPGAYASVSSDTAKIHLPVPEGVIESRTYYASLPDSVGRFVKAFDRGEYRELIAGELGS